MANTSLGFSHISESLSTITSPEVGCIYFSASDHTIGVGTASGMEKYYGGNVANATYADKKLTITYNDGTATAVLDFSDVASAEGVSSLLGGLRKDVDTLLDASHTHANGTVLDGITAEQITDWDAVAAKKSDYDAHVADDDIHVTTEDKATWSGKQDALSDEDLTRIAAVDNKAESTTVDSLEKYVKGDDKDGNGGLEKRISDLEEADGANITAEQIEAWNAVAEKKDDYDTHVADTDIHITSDERTAWNAYAASKQDALSAEDLARIAAVDDKADSADLGTAAAKNVLTGTIADSTSDDLVTAAQVKAYAAGVVGAMHFRGVVDSTDDVENPASGDICLVGTKEYVYDGSNWALFGDEGAYDAKGTAQDLIDALGGEVSSTAGADVVVTVKTSKGEVSEVSVDSSVLANNAKAYTDDRLGDLGKVNEEEDADDHTVKSYVDAKVQQINDAAFEGVENEDTNQYVKVSDVANNKQTLSVTIGSFSVPATGDTEAVAQVAGLATVEDVEKIITDNEKVTSAALNDLNDRVNDVIGTADDEASADTVNGAKAYADAAAATVKTELIGTDDDTADDDTIKGAKKYAESVVAAGLVWKTF